MTAPFSELPEERAGLGRCPLIRPVECSQLPVRIEGIRGQADEAPQATNVVDLMAVLQGSRDQAQRGREEEPAALWQEKTAARKTVRKPEVRRKATGPRVRCGS